MTTTTSWISKKPERCGGDACVRTTRITVWILEQWRRLGKSDVWLLENYPTVTAQDLAAAWDYIAANPEEIEDAIRRNTET